jgi:hypothetical protein
MIVVWLTLGICFLQKFDITINVQNYDSHVAYNWNMFLAKICYHYKCSKYYGTANELNIPDKYNYKQIDPDSRCCCSLWEFEVGVVWFSTLKAVPLMLIILFPSFILH